MSGYAAGMVAAGGGNCCGSNKGCAAKGGKMHTECAVPTGTLPRSGKRF